MTLFATREGTLDVIGAAISQNLCACSDTETVARLDEDLPLGRECCGPSFGIDDKSVPRQHPTSAMTHSGHGGWFAKTQWTVIWAAKADDSVIAQQARERLCQTYRQPVYWFCLRQGLQPADAEDLVQDFFARLLHEKSWLNHLQHQQGRFRNFLLTVLKNFLSDHRDREMAQKRGGGKPKLSLDDTVAVASLGAAMQHGGMTPDEVFDRKWADSLFQSAARALRDEYHARNKGPLYEAIKDLVPGQHGEKGYAEIGAALGMTEPAIKNAVHRFRERQRELIREEVAATVETPQQLEEELQHLIELLSR